MERNGAWIEEIEGSLQKDAAEGKIKKADTWDEIAEWIGTDPKALMATVEQYNSYCDKGYDADFVTEVINRQDRPISGLYAAGDTTTGCEAVYNHKYPGSALCFALVSGQIAGENAAKFILGK